MMNKLLIFLVSKKLRGAGFLTRFFRKNRLLRFRTKHGSKFMLNPYDYIDNKVIREGYFDNEVLEVLESSVEDGDVYWDIGAHMGLHSMTLGVNYPGLKINAFEPSNRNFLRLRRNASLNEVRNLKLFNFAIGSDDQVLPFYENIHNTGNSGIRDQGEYYIATVSVDKLVFLGFDIPQIMKIDVEGFEVEVFKGMKNLLKSAKLKVIVFETYNHLEWIKKFLSEFGYDVNRISNKDDYVAKKRGHL